MKEDDPFRRELWQPGFEIGLNVGVGVGAVDVKEIDAGVGEISGLPRKSIPLSSEKLA